MAVLPGSLDYLYYNGITDHIPYEAYYAPYGTQGSVPITPGGNYIDQAKQGLLYDTYTSPDTFVRRDTSNYRQSQNYSFARSAYGYGDGIGTNSDFEVNAVGHEGKAFRQSIFNGAKNAANSAWNAPTFVKGLAGFGVILGTLYCLLRKPSTKAVSTGNKWLSKLNPKNWCNWSNIGKRVSNFFKKKTKPSAPAPSPSPAPTQTPAPGNKNGFLNKLKLKIKNLFKKKNSNNP